MQRIKFLNYTPLIRNFSPNRQIRTFTTSKLYYCAIWLPDRIQYYSAIKINNATKREKVVWEYRNYAKHTPNYVFASFESFSA